MTDLKVGVVKPIDNIPSQCEELPPLNEEAVEEAEREEQLLVHVLTMTPREGLLVYHLVETLHVRLQALCVCVCAHACVCACACMRVCMCVCVREREKEKV